MPHNHNRRGLWIWNSNAILASSIETDQLLTGAQDAGVTDLYLYTAPDCYAAQRPQLQTFISSATTFDQHVWALDGDRAYFADAAGPADFKRGIENLIAYNEAVAPHERFFGFQADNEPHDHGEYRTFHNGVADSALSEDPGSCVWQSTQAHDRKVLLRSWLSMYQTARQLLRTHGLCFGAAMPWWTESYEGGELGVRFPDRAGIRQSVMKHMMALVDDYVVMSYHADPANAVRRVEVQAAYASSIPADRRPRVYASVEVAPGVGGPVSYGDAEGKNSKAVVLRDMTVITEGLSRYPAFGGIAVHQWSAWQSIPE
ncbi:hypothetical protein B0A55_05138 [Friedmanniomyces simplex]|uniref:Uncharacterized protein n=1 Tax=Friedmanniomyces simplex TaxID=329884 RepID=A0A4U0XBT8_9PEZI|nr:hypothetical protein B0A55_05138 [Friedmanniomyces simplex]